MPTIGTNYRAKPRVRIRKGYSPVDPSNLVESFPAKPKEDIKSGMLVCKNSDKLLVKATRVLLDAGARPYIAQADQADFSAESAGLVPVIVCDGNYKVESAYFDAGAYNDGDLLVGSTTAGNFAKYTATAGEDPFTIVGTATGIVSYAGALPNTGINDEADPASFDGDVLSFYTKHQRVLVPTPL